ncbi:MAG TPA: hypothetical protein VF937_02550, partial [Chloroflexota bacterium]
MVSTGQTSFDPLELRERAVRFVASRGTATEDEILAHVYGGLAPAVLRARLAAPLLADPRLQHQSDGRWTMRDHASDESPGTAFTALAVVATGPTPGRGRPVHISALHVRATGVLGRFEATLNPHARMPRYVAQRLGLEAEVLDGQPDFEAIFDDLVHFLARRPVLAQDARLTWSFLGVEARRIGRTLEEPVLLDLNELATRLLDLKVKPSLGVVAAQLGIGSLRIAHPDEEARVLGIVGARLLAMDVPDGVGRSDARLEPGPRAPLRRGATARELPDLPGVYILRDVDQTPLYVGKARRLSSRMAAYVHRPLGATRRLEGLVAAVHSVDSTPCATDLEALILEDREIRRLQPRFNTARRQRPVRLWIRLPAERPPATGRRQRAPLRLELSARSSGAEGEHVGPFRNESLAAQARQLAREVFDLDALRRGDRHIYTQRLAQAWAFLHGSRDAAEERA